MNLVTSPPLNETQQQEPAVSVTAAASHPPPPIFETGCGMYVDQEGEPLFAAVRLKQPSERVTETSADEVGTITPPIASESMMPNLHNQGVSGAWRLGLSSIVPSGVPCVVRMHAHTHTHTHTGSQEIDGPLSTTTESQRDVKHLDATRSSLLLPLLPLPLPR